MEVKVEFSFPKLEFVSDRTFRETLKMASQRLHQIHLHEVQYILETSDLSARLRQSATDRMAGQLDHIPNYYIESVTRGSLTLLVCLSSVAIFVLQKTLGKTIEASWERTPTHKRLVAFLSNTTVAENAPAPALRRRKSSSQNLGERGERWQWLVREFSYEFLNKPRFGRFQVVRLDFKPDRNRDMLVRIEFGLSHEHLELEGTFKQFLYQDYFEHFKQRSVSKKKPLKEHQKTKAKK